ncbi:hypothetical protein EW145_g3502 [Phellinidium pouzarii]|uniref:F-box domain-containing protein n=1 Tax=Phellinidium pouzarii TaxID=167371 RepID=A0A4S4L794_9AGAM|nr:hypothetical protein EW145_g3502 [Phellinidium pouzarii]
MLEEQFAMEIDDVKVQKDDDPGPSLDTFTGTTVRAAENFALSPQSVVRPLNRLQGIITGDKSKAMKLKKRQKPQDSNKSAEFLNGKLKLMLQIPVDVFREIVLHLLPLDLLHLARSTRDLRSMLMSRSSRNIWRTVLSVLNIPPLEESSDFNEPQLVSLMFEEFCQGCDAPRVHKADYGLRHANAVESWFQKRNDQKAEEDELKIRSRHDSILEKLKSFGFKDEDLESADDDSNWKWDKLLNQPVELTVEVWDSIRPRLERIIRLRKAKKARIALRETACYKNLLEIYQKFTDEWIANYSEVPSLDVSEIEELPMFKTLLSRNGATTSIEENNFKALLTNEAVHRYEKRLKEDFAAFVVAARDKAGLFPLCNRKTLSPTDTILGHASAFLSKHPKAMFGIESYKEFENRPRDPKKKWPCRYPPPSSVPKFADALLRSLNMSLMTTMEEMEKLGKSFVCKCCPEVAKTKMSWKALVFHFCKEEDWYLDAKQKLAEAPARKVKIIDDHDVNIRKDLAELVVFGVATGGFPFLNVYDVLYSCPPCTSLGIYTYGYKSRKEIEAHTIAKHGKTLDTYSPYEYL